MRTFEVTTISQRAGSLWQIYLISIDLCLLVLYAILDYQFSDYARLYDSGMTRVVLCFISNHLRQRPGLFSRISSAVSLSSPMLQLLQLWQIFLEWYVQ